MARKTHDIVAKVGEYTDRQGQTKPSYKNVGALMQGDNGPFLMLERTFNPAGMPIDGRGNVILSCFEPRQQDGQQNGGQQRQQDSGNRAGYDAQRPQGGGYGGAAVDASDIPFSPCVLL